MPLIRIVKIIYENAQTVLCLCKINGSVERSRAAVILFRNGNQLATRNIHTETISVSAILYADDVVVMVFKEDYFFELIAHKIWNGHISKTNSKQCRSLDKNNMSH